MKNLFKKISALVLTAIMVLTMCSAVFADDAPKYPTAKDRAKIVVKNVEETATVTAYRVVKPVYIDGIGFEKYEKLNGVNIANPIKPTSNEIIDIAQKIVAGDLNTIITEANNDKITLTKNAEGDFVGDAGAGYWIVLVTGNVQEVYNPMLAGVYYNVSGSNTGMLNGEVNANSDWNLEGTILYKKSVDVDYQNVNKIIANSDAKIVDTNDASTKGDDIAAKDIAKFEVITKIPDYTNTYKEATYVIHDKLDLGFNFDANSAEIYVNDKKVDEGQNTYTIAKDNQNNITVTFNKTYVVKNANKTIKFKYDATLNLVKENKVNVNTNFTPNKNTVYVTYSVDPSNVDNVKNTPEHKTYHYTFELGGNVNGNSTDKTTVFKKTGEETVEGQTKYNPLPGAEFTLTRTDKNKIDSEKYIYTATSDNNGSLNFAGLEAGNYTLKETKAPDGYSLNKTVYNVIITAAYNLDGTLNNYSVDVNVNGENGKTFTYTNTKEGVTTVITGDEKPYEIKNTKISTLPSTGGMGTYLFTIVGVVLMTCAAGAFFVSRRKTNK